MNSKQSTTIGFSLCTFGWIITCLTVNGNEHPTLAITRTFAPSDVDSLPESFERWKTFPPCHPDSMIQVDLFLVYSQNLDDSIYAQAAIRAVQEIFDYREGWNDCIFGVFGFGVDIEPAQDNYLMDERESNILWVNGPNRQFERTIRALQKGPHECMYLMEMDSMPVKAYWLDAIMEEINVRSEFVMLGSKYRGDKWDGFREQLPASLLKHINGNAIYNLTHPVLSKIVEQLEREAKTIANSVPYDLRISQIMEEVTNGLVPVINSIRGQQPQRYRLPIDVLSTLIDYNLDALMKETLLIGNYAYSYVLPSHIHEKEFIVHGATMLFPWDSGELGDISLIVSDGDPPRAQPMLLSLDVSKHPFSNAIIVTSGTQPRGLHAPEKVPVHFVSRFTKSSTTDLCTVDVKTPWFVLSSADFELKSGVQIMVHFDTKGFRPIISFVPADNDSCFVFPTCTRSLGMAQSIASGYNKVFQEYGFVFHTESRDKYCQFLQTGHNPTIWKDFPGAMSYVAYLERTGVLDELYVLSDQSLFGSHAIFVPTLWEYQTTNR